MRIARAIVPGALYHVISQFIDREFVFRGAIDRELYLRLFGAALRRSDWLCVAYALMSNHIHLALVAGRRPIGSLLKSVNAPFAREMNAIVGGIGPLFAERADTWRIRAADEGRVIAYVHNNPVRAGLAAYARDSAWTSHRAYVGLASRPAWLNVELGLARAGATHSEFDAWVNAAATGDLREEIAGVHRMARRRGAIELATPTANPTEVPLVIRPWAWLRPDPRSVVAAVASTVKLPIELICSRGHAPALVAARRVAIHSGIRLGLVASEIAAALGISRQAAARLAHDQCDENAVAIVTKKVDESSTVPR